MNPPQINLQLQDIRLNGLETRRIERQLARLARRIRDWDPEPRLDLRLSRIGPQQVMRAALRVQKGHLGTTVAADADATTVDKAVRIAVSRIERQLMQREERIRGKPSYGVPSRRFPERRRLSRALRADRRSGNLDDAGEHIDRLADEA